MAGMERAGAEGFRVIHAMEFVDVMCSRPDVFKNMMFYMEREINEDIALRQLNTSEADEVLEDLKTLITEANPTKEALLHRVEIAKRCIEGTYVESEVSLKVDEALQILDIAGSLHDVIFVNDVEMTPADLEAHVERKWDKPCGRILARDVDIHYTDLAGKSQDSDLGQMVIDRLLERQT